MGQQSGANAKIIYDSEKAYKTNPDAPDATTLPFVSESFAVERALVSSRTIRSSRQPQMPVRGRLSLAGAINFELSPEYGRLLKHIFGSQAKTGAEAPYTWTHKIAALPYGMVMEKQYPSLDTAKYFLYNGVKVNSFRCSGGAEGFIDCTVNLIGAKETIGGSSFDASGPSDFGHTPFDGFEATIKQGGSALTEVVTSFEFTLDNALDDSIYAIGGAGIKSALPEGVAKVTGRLTSFFANTTLYDLAVASTETSLEISFAHGDGSGTSGKEKLSFLMDEMKFSPRSPVISGPTGLFVELGFEAYYRADADASALRAILLSPKDAF